MRLLAPVLTSVAACALAASSAAAQACVGLPSFDHVLHLNVAGEFPEAAKAYAVGLGAGKANGPFGNVGVGQVTYDDFEEKSTLGFAEVGFQIPLSRVQICPLAGGSYAVGPNDDLIELEVSQWSATAGAAVGLPLDAGPAQLIPNVALRYEHTSQDVKETGFDPATFTFKATVLDLGLALVLMDRISVQPLAHITLSSSVDSVADQGGGGADDEEDVSFGVFLSIGFP
jgi:hypothetical protein